MVHNTTQSKLKNAGIMGIYGRKFLFFILLFLVIFSIYKIVISNYITADVAKITDKSYTSNLKFDIKITKEGNLVVNNQNFRNKISLYEDFDELRLPIIDNPEKYYDKVIATVTLPKDNAEEVEHAFLGIHGVGETTSYINGSNKIVYEAYNVSKSSTLTVVAKMPKGTISPSLIRQIGQLFKDIKQTFWFIIAVLLPVMTFIVMMVMLFYQYKRQKIDVPEKETATPPMAIPPAIVGVLFNQKVSSREIAGTLINLAIRGDIVILDEERGFAFGKGKFDQRLLGYEKMLLSKIFRSNLTSDKQEIEKRINRHFYSKKISLVSTGIYALTTRLGYFKVNPQKYHAKFRLLGIFLFLIALGGFTLNMTIFTEVEYAVFFWVGMMVSALVIAFVAKSLPIRTVIGQEVLSNWLAFRKFLTNPEPFPYAVDNQKIFQKYLSYAIVMECETAWAKRFYKHNFIMPAWFLTDKGKLGLEDFCLSLFPIVSYVSRSLASSREPGFE